MSKAEERGKTYALHKASEKLHDYYGNAMLSVVQFDGYDIKKAYIDGYRQAEKDLSDISWIKEVSGVKEMKRAKEESAKTIAKMVQLAYMAGASEADINPIKEEI